jgi:hypothetical protein
MGMLKNTMGAFATPHRLKEGSITQPQLQSPAGPQLSARPGITNISAIKEIVIIYLSKLTD